MTLPGHSKQKLAGKLRFDISHHISFLRVAFANIQSMFFSSLPTIIIIRTHNNLVQLLLRLLNHSKSETCNNNTPCPCFSLARFAGEVKLILHYAIANHQVSCLCLAYIVIVIVIVIIINVNVTVC